MPECKCKTAKVHGDRHIKGEEVATNTGRRIRSVYATNTGRIDIYILM